MGEMKMNRKNLVNYELNNSNSNNYGSFETSSSPESFPKLVGNGVFVEYKQVNYASDFLKEPDSAKQNTPNMKNKCNT